MPTGPDNEDTPAEPPLADAGSDRCSNCGTPLATDQRYCVNCGERRGKPRFGAPIVAGAPMADPVPAASAPPPARARFSPGTTLVAGVATLLLAMGVGVLIGENGAGNNLQRASAAAPVIHINNGGGGGTTAGTSGGSSNSTGTGSSKHSGKSSKHKSSSNTSSSPTVVHLTKKVSSQIKSAVNNVVGTNSNLAAPTTKLGGKCKSGQAGCQGGKFTGNFFGGG